MRSLKHLQRLYDSSRFQEAFRKTAEYWQPSTDLRQLSIEEVVFAGRLAGQLGGLRLSRWLLRAALGRDPLNPSVRYFTNNIRRRPWRLLDELHELEVHPDLEQGDAELRAWWFGSQALTWASLRDFNRGNQCIQRAHSLASDDSWVYSCESNLFGCADRWEDALRTAERACELNPDAPFSLHSLGNSLLHLGRVREAAHRISQAAESTESFMVAGYACWIQCALAETLDSEERGVALNLASRLARKTVELAPLADRETQMRFAIMRLDLAELSDDRLAMERWANEVRSPFHRQMLANLRKNPAGARIRLPFRPAIQKHDACLPTSLASALAAMGVDISPDEMAMEVTFGGTTDWEASEWLQKRGLVVRSFTVTPEVAVRLIQHGIAFVLTLVGDENAHAVAVVGLDEAAGTLLVHDPRSFRTTSYLVERIGQGQAPLAPKGMAVVPPESAELLDQLLPDDARVMEAALTWQKAVAAKGSPAARPIVTELSQRFPLHPGRRLLGSIHALEEGQTGEAIAELKKLLTEFPSSSVVRRHFINACRAIDNTALMRSTLNSVIETGVLPGIQSQQDWIYPPGRYVAEYAELLGQSAATRDRARSMLQSVIKREPTSPQAWSVLGNLLWRDRERERALLCYRIASCLASENEPSANSYWIALGHLHREQEGLDWLESRARSFGKSVRAVGTWLTWISALESFGHPTRAIAVCTEALHVHRSDPGMLAFAVSFFARMGNWQEAKEHLQLLLESSGNSASFHEAAALFYQMRGDLDNAVSNAEACVRDRPRHMPMRYSLLDIITMRDGPGAACRRAAQWVTEYPAHEEFENAYCTQLERTSNPKWKTYSVLLRRVKRNSEDGWAWRGLAFNCIHQYSGADDRHRRKLAPRIARFLAECDRTAPEDAATVRAHANWWAACGEWSKAVAAWLVAIEREPDNFYSYQRTWECSASFDHRQQKQLWEKIKPHLLNIPGRLSMAREMMALLAERLGMDEAEQEVSQWEASRPDDPGVVEAVVDLLLEHGHGRPDAERALAKLKPAAERFPWHLGLRLSLAQAYRRLGRNDDAEAVYLEIIRRHPTHAGAQIQLAWIFEGCGKAADALELLQAAQARDPHNYELRATQAQLLFRIGHTNAACEVIDDGLKFMPENVGWRRTAIELLLQCGLNEKAIEAARGGVQVHPNGAYLWLVLGKTLSEAHRGAEGEIESCLRRSLSLNASLFESADRLACLLSEQHRVEEAEQVLRAIEPHMADPSPARGRLAWIKRQQGLNREAIDDMALILSRAPSYRFGWNLLIEWLTADQAWDQARSILGTVHPVLRTDISFRKQRLALLEKAGLAARELDAEWDTLLKDFPEDIPLHLQRYDGLRASNRLADSAIVLRTIHAVELDNLYVRARLVDLLVWENRKKEALETALGVWFSPEEGSAWPADQVMTVLEKAGLADEFCITAHRHLEQGAKPTTRALKHMAEQTMKRGKAEKRIQQPLMQQWFPGIGARGVLALLQLVDRADWADSGHRSVLLKILAEYGYQRPVVEYWVSNPHRVEADFASWAETGRALITLKRMKEARELMAGWRERTDIKMWGVANYVLAHPARRRAHLQEVASSCRDALAKLPHDHCARFLAHKQAEAYALLGDTEAFLQTWNCYRNYFATNLANGEFFKDRYLLSDIPTMGHLLQQNQIGLYRNVVRGLRWQSVWGSTAGGANPLANIPWWVWILLMLGLTQIFGNNTNGQ